MPIKKVVSVDFEDVDSKFKSFAKDFHAYTEQLAKAPAGWEKSSKHASETNKAIKSLAALMVGLKSTLLSESSAMQNMATSSRVIRTSWADIASKIKSASRDFGSMITKVAKADLWATGIMGLVGAGGLWGFNRLASSAAGGRRSSTGLGLDYGNMKSFGITYGRFIDPASYLSAISQARGNIGSPEATSLYSLGINPMTTSSGDAAKQALRRVYELSRQTPEGLLGPVVQQGFGAGALGHSVEDLRRLKGMSPEEFNKYEKDQEALARQVQVRDEELRKMQEFTVKLDAAGQKIESTFIRGLARFGDPLGKLSDAISNVIERFMGSQGFDALLEKAEKGLDRFATYISDPKFLTDVEKIANKFGYLAEKLDVLMRFLGVLPGGTQHWAGNPNYTQDQVDFGNKVRRFFGIPERGPAGGGKGGGGVKTLPDGTPIMDAMPSGYTKSSGDFIAPFVQGVPTRFNPDPMNNPLSMMPGGQMAKYSTPEEGLRAAYKNMYDLMGNKDTLRKLIYTWTPPDDGSKGTKGNRPDLILENFKTWANIDPDARLNRNDPNTMALLMSLVARQEGNYKNWQQYTPAAIKVVIEDRTGGNANAAVNQMSVFN